MIDSPIKRKGGFYIVDGKKEPDAWKTQTVANDNKVRTVIRVSEQTEDYAKVIARSIAPSGWYVEASVIHVFNTEMQKKAMEYLLKDTDRVADGQEPKVFADVDRPFDSHGRPILSQNGQLILLNRMLRFKSIAVRDAESKAARRSQMKAMNSDWREEGELQAEIDEIAMVQLDISESKGAEPALQISNNKPDTAKLSEAVNTENINESTPNRPNKAVQSVPANVSKAVTLPELPNKSSKPLKVNLPGAKNELPDSDLKAIDDATDEPDRIETKKEPFKQVKVILPDAANIIKEDKKNAEAIKKLDLPVDLSPEDQDHLIKTTYLDDDGKEIKKPDNLAKETVLGPESTEREIKQAATEIKEQYLTEQASDELNKLKRKNVKDLSEADKQEIHRLQEDLRKKGVETAMLNDIDLPKRPDQIRKPTGFKELKGR